MLLEAFPDNPIDDTLAIEVVSRIPPTEPFKEGKPAELI
jgi:hypothetical protein